MAPVTEKAKTAPVRKTRFDLTEREQLRSALLRYMEAHRIGVPTLQARIAEAADRSVDLIPLKTLQRFLAGAARTNDAFLIPCDQFAGGMPDYGEPKEVTPDEFARALGWFLKSPAPDRAGSGRPEARTTAITGHYKVCAEHNPAAEKTPSGFRLVAKTETITFSLPVSDIRFEGPGGGSWARVREEVFNPASRPAVASREGQERHLYEGVALDRDALIFVLLRNMTTRLPKAYWLKRADDRTLGGSGVESRFTPGQAGWLPLLIQSSDFALYRTAETPS